MPLNGLALTAQWTPTQYTITFDSAGGSPVTSITADLGAAVTAPANPTRAGYTFAGWSPAFPATMPLNGLALTAQWVALATYTVTFDANGGTGTMANQTANVPTALTSNTFTRTGYNFSGWNTVAGGGGTAYANGASYDFAADVTLYAQWSALPTHTVIFDANGGSPVSGQTIAHGGLVTQPSAPTRTGYNFNGWFKDAAVTDDWVFTTDTVTTATTLYAKWTAVSTGGGSGGGGFGNQLIGIGLAGTSPWMDGNGRAVTAGQIRTADGRLNLTIPVGTAVWNAAGAAQAYLSAAALAEPPQAPPQNSRVMAYEIGPTGVTFTPTITMTLNYTDVDVPAGTREADLYIAWWDGAKWVKLEGTVNPAANTVTVQISHFTNFALFVPAAPPPSTAPTLKIGTPTAGASLDSGTVSISIITTNIALVANNRPNAAGEARAIYYLDVPIPTTLGQSAFSATGTYRETDSWTNIWTDLAPGTHTLGVQLVQNDHTPFNPPVFATVTVIVKEAVIAPPATSTPAVTQPSLPTTSSSDLTKTNWGIPIFFLVAALALGVVLYWKSRRPVEKLRYTNR
jgi:uncharacterized repeat protein (TIGR02543 family)